MRKSTIKLLTSMLLGGLIATPVVLAKRQGQLPQKPDNTRYAKPAKVSLLDRHHEAETLIQSRTARLTTTTSAKRIGSEFDDSNGATVYAILSVDFSDENSSGFYQIDRTGNLKFIADVPSEGPEGGEFIPSAMYLRNSKLITFGQETFYGFFVGGNYSYEYDMETGEGGFVERGYESEFFYKAAYDAEKDLIMGYWQDPITEQIFYGTAPGSDPAEVTMVSAIDDYELKIHAMTYNQVTGKLIAIYGLEWGGTIMEIDPATGKGEEKGTVETPSDFATGLAYSPIDGGYYYAYCNNKSDGGCGMQFLNPGNFTVMQDTPYAENREYLGFYCPDGIRIEAEAPGDTELVSIDFPNGNLSGNMTFKFAGDTHGGTPIIGDIHWQLDIDGDEYKSGEVAAGSTTTVEIGPLTEGEHNFTMRSFIASFEGRICEKVAYIGNDTPMATASVTLTDQSISWQPVTNGIHRGYINPDEVTYNVYLNDQLIEKDLKATSCLSQIPQDATLSLYTASVEAVFANHVSEKTYSNDIKAGDALSIPFSLQPTEKESILFSIENCNEGPEVMFSNAAVDNEDFSGYFYNYSRLREADDWLFLPPANFTDANAVYEFTANIFSTDKGYQEKYEVALCSAPNSQSIVKSIQPVTDAPVKDSGVSYKEIVDHCLFSVPESGIYHVGLHVCSEKDMSRLYMTNFSITPMSGMSASAPMAATDVIAAAKPEGELGATVSFTFPLKNIAGEDMTADTVLTAIVGVEGGDETSVAGKPGQSVSVDVKAVQGDNAVTVTIYNGELKGIQTSTSVFCGIDIPLPPNNLKIEASEDNMTALLSWEAPDKGENGGYVNPAEITYLLCQYVTNASGQSGWTIIGEIGTDVYSTSADLPQDTPLGIIRLGVATQNSTGRSSYLSTGGCVLGIPLEIPYLNSYTAQQNTTPIVSYTSGLNLKIGDPATDFPQYSTTDNANALYAYGNSAVSDASFSLPKFSTVGAKSPAVELQVYGKSCRSFSVYASTFGVSPIEIKTYASDDFTDPGPTTVKVELPTEFANCQWVEVYIHFDTDFTTEAFILYSWRFFDNLARDFGIESIEGPTRIEIGEEALFKAYIRNFGYESGVAPAGKWTIIGEDGKVVANVDVAATNETIAANGIMIAETAFVPDADNFGKQTLVYTIENYDDKMSNNSASLDLDVVKGVVPVIVDLKADEIESDHITLAWSPIAADNSVIENFEDETPFILDDASEMIGQFKRIDGDKQQVYTTNNTAFMNQPWAGRPASFIVYSQQQIEEIYGKPNLFKAHSGDKFLMAFCPFIQNGDPVAADDWLISPEVEPSSQASIWLRALEYGYGPEEVEIMYSSTGDNPSEFKLLERVSLNGEAGQEATWQQVNIQLPDNARYFAVHYVSNNIFGILVDDIKFTPAGSDLRITGFNIIRNEMEIAYNEPCIDNRYVDSNVELPYNYTYVVVPVLSDGTMGFNSNTVSVIESATPIVITGNKTVSASGNRIIVKGYEGCSISILTIDGVLRSKVDKAASEEEFQVEPGIYIVETDDRSLKVICR